MEKPCYKKQGFNRPNVLYKPSTALYKKLEISTNHIICTALYEDQDKINYKLF